MLEPEVRAGTVASPEECERIALWNRTQADYPRNLCVHQLIELQARENPSKVAVEFQGQQLSYEEVSRRSNRLAHLLRKKGVKADVLVGLCVDRSAEMLIALLGILKAGGAYVPLDPAYPADRIQYVLSDANAKVLITESRLLPSLPKLSADIVCLDRVSLDQESSQECQTEVKPENLAYVIYTSGSTGKPKGVQLEHRSVINFLCSMQKEPGLSSSDILVAVTTLSFDIAGLEMYLPLISGARVVIASREATYDARLLSQILDRSGATVMQATPATWRLLFESGWKGDRKLKVLVGGEALPAELAQQLVAHCGPVWNMYGPTETTIWSSVYRVRGDEERILPIGRPIANTTLYILDENRLPVCIGKEGELYIGGEGLARGYFGRPELTAEKFLDDPFRHGERMYRTGDLARFREDGNVEFLGRMDHQVKIRGFRIELGEIEAVLEQHPAIRRAVVIAREDAAGEKKLAAYVVSHPDQVVTSGSLREHVREQLPDYMIPAAFVQLAVLPLTPNGKVDRKALPAPASGDFESSHEYVAPRDPIELKLARIWEETLAMRPVGVKTSFFDLGGRSVLAARMFMKISREFGKDLPLSLLFQAPTIEQLATELRTQGQKSTSYSTLVEIQPRGSRPPFFCVHGGAGSTLFLHRLSREMASDQPFYGFEPEGMDGRRFQRTTVEQMAKHYIAEMRKIQPQGPYLIGGYCFGGLVAFEMAQQLRKQGQPPALIAMFSAPLRFHRVARRAKAPAGTMASSSRWARFLRSPGQAICWRFVSGTRRFRSWMHMTVCRAFLRLGMRVPQTLRTMYVVRMIHQAEQSYEPSFYDGTLTLFRGKGLYEDDPDMGWDGLAKRLENFEIGDGGLRSRRDIMNEPLVGLLAKELAVCFERATGKQFPNVDGCEENARGATAVPAAGPR
ncbi:MAG TPA: amino acid adenylation domain-containing protein [Terriglobales bacterium]|nr:amino acid adenylation domain-containing protein [Terriglobales bacterium]